MITSWSCSRYIVCGGCGKDLRMMRTNCLGRLGESACWRQIYNFIHKQVQEKNITKNHSRKCQLRVIFRATCDQTNKHERKKKIRAVISTLVKKPGGQVFTQPKLLPHFYKTFCAIKIFFSSWCSCLVDLCFHLCALQCFCVGEFKFPRCFKFVQFSLHNVLTNPARLAVHMPIALHVVWLSKFSAWFAIDSANSAAQRRRVNGLVKRQSTRSFRQHFFTRKIQNRGLISCLAEATLPFLSCNVRKSTSFSWL